MPFGFSGADHSMNRRRRWLAQLPEETPPVPSRRSRSEAASSTPDAPSPPTVAPLSGSSSLIPERPWKIWTLVVLAWLTGIACVVGGAWLDRQGASPFREILGLRAGRLLHFYTTIALLVCTQMSYLIFWRRSQSRKDFAGRYRAWFWVGAVCSVYCVAVGTRFHERWAHSLIGDRHFGWIDAATVTWMMPATIMLISAMHLMRRDMRHCVLSTRLVTLARGLAIVAGLGVTLGPLFLAPEWISPVRSSLGALWSAMFATALVWHARFVTHITNEAAPRDRTAPVRPWWQSRIRTFVRQFKALLLLEWQTYRERKRTAATTTKPDVKTPIHSEPVRQKPVRQPVETIAERTTAPLRSMAQSRVNDNEGAAAAPPTRAVNLRPITRTESAPPVPPSRPTAPPSAPIPAPHFSVSAIRDFGEEESETTDEETMTLPPGQTAESWQNMSKKERKRLQRAQRIT